MLEQGRRGGKGQGSHGPPNFFEIVRFSDTFMFRRTIFRFAVGKDTSFVLYRKVFELGLSPPPLCRCHDGSVPENSKELEEPPFSVPGRAGEENIARFQFIQELLL